jgi:hypothetical protein
MDALVGGRRMPAALLESTTLGSDADRIETIPSTNIGASISREQ